jgi:hypothetical protein
MECRSRLNLFYERKMLPSYVLLLAESPFDLRLARILPKYISSSPVICALRSTVISLSDHAVTSRALNMVVSPTFIHNSYCSCIFRFSFPFLSPTFPVRLLGGPSACWKVTTAWRKTPFSFTHLLSARHFHLDVVPLKATHRFKLLNWESAQNERKA